jgi:competence protein ComEC
MNTQMYPFLRIAIVLVAGIMTGDVLYGHVPVRLVFCVLVVLFVHHRMRVLGQVLAMVVIWAYATLVGMPPSVLRSATMLTIFAFVVLTGRRQVSLNTLAFAAVVQLAINPLSLWDVGFQMSFLAVLGIVMLNLRLRDVATPIWLSRWRVIRWMWSLVKVSLAAQIAVAPLSMYYFGTFPCYFLLTNLIAVPLAMLILYSSVVMYLYMYARRCHAHADNAHYRNDRSAVAHYW